HCCHDHAHSPDLRRNSLPKDKGARQYFCPICEGIESDEPGNCPKCGMRLERNPAGLTTQIMYTCPMHPEIQQDHPGNCPVCGMTLEPKNVVGADAAENAELRDMTRRFWVGALLSTPVFLLAMAHVF